MKSNGWCRPHIKTNSRICKVKGSALVRVSQARARVQFEWFVDRRRPEVTPQLMTRIAKDDWVAGRWKVWGVSYWVLQNNIQQLDAHILVSYSIAHCRASLFEEKAVGSHQLLLKRKDASGVKCKWLNPVAARQYRLSRLARLRELTKIRTEGSNPWSPQGSR